MLIPELDDEHSVVDTMHVRAHGTLAADLCMG
jgi:hypothetical protein